MIFFLNEEENMMIVFFTYMNAERKYKIPCHPVDRATFPDDDVENSSPMGHTVLATQNRTCTAKTIKRKTFREHRCGAGLTLSEGQVRIRPFPF